MKKKLRKVNKRKVNGREKVKIKEIRKMKPKDLDKKLSELRLELSKELGNVKMGRAVKNPGKIKQMRKSIAQILTVKRDMKEMKKGKIVKKQKRLK